MFVTLKEIHASDDQRLAVMAAWDEYEDARKALEARFDARVQAALDKDQWRDWQRQQAQADELGERPERGGGRRGRGR